MVKFFGIFTLIMFVVAVAAALPLQTSPPPAYTVQVLGTIA